MALILRQLTNTGSPLYKPDGTLLSNAQITFTLCDAAGYATDAFDALTGERVTGSVTALLDSNGIFSVELWPNDRGDRETMYLCQCTGTKDFISSVPEHNDPLTWLEFKYSGTTLTPVEVSSLNLHIADLAAHAGSQLSNNPATTSGLVYGYLNGVVRTDNSVVNVLGGTVLLAANSLNYVEIDSTGLVTANTVGFTLGRFPMATAQTNASTITSIVNKRSQVNFGSELRTYRDASGGYVGKTLESINFLNTARTFTNYLTNNTTASRTYTFQDRSGIIADDSDIATRLAIMNNLSDLNNLVTSRNNLEVYSRIEVDNLFGGTNIAYYLTDTVSDVGDYLYLANRPTGEVESSVSAAIVTSPTLIKSFITKIGEFSALTLVHGVYQFHIHATKTVGTKVAQIYSEMYIRTSLGVETLISTSEVTPSLGPTNTPYEIYFTIVNDLQLNVGDRIVIKVYGIASGGGTTPTVAVYSEGVNSTRVEITTTSDVYDSRYFVKVGLDGGQTIFGGLTASSFLLLNSTTHATKGLIALGSLSNGLIFDEATYRLGLGVVPTSKLHIVLPANDNIVVDARSYPRTVTPGVFRINHTAGISGTRCFNLDIDMNGFADTHSLVIDYKLTGLNPGMYANNFQVNYDTANSSGGTADVLDITKVGTGLADITVMHAGGGINPIRQTQGDYSLVESAFSYSGSFVNVTNAFNVIGTDVLLFNQQFDYIYIGMNSKFSALLVTLQTVASASIVPIFQYSTGGGGWTTFAPGDGTNGFRISGAISWTIQSLSTWALDTVNGVSGKYWIRVQRTVQQLGTKPIESCIHAQQGNVYGWDKNANISISRIKATGLPTYADRAAALAGGLTTGDFYQTAVGVLMVV